MKSVFATLKSVVAIYSVHWTASGICICIAEQSGLTFAQHVESTETSTVEYSHKFKDAEHFYTRGVKRDVVNGLTLLESGGRSSRGLLSRGPCIWIHTHVTRRLRAYLRIQLWR